MTLELALNNEFGKLYQDYVRYLTVYQQPVICLLF